MDRHAGGKNVWPMLVISVVVTLAGSCATVPSYDPPIRGLEDVAGEWEGTACSWGGGTMTCIPVVIAIMENGTGVSVVANRRDPITWSLKDGKIRITNQVTGATSTSWLSIVGGNRVLIYQSDNGYRGEFKAVKKDFKEVK